MRFFNHITLIIFFSFNVAVAQTPATNELDKQYTPGQNSIFNSNSKANNSGNSNSRSITEIKNAIKFNPLLLGRSTIAFFYERRIASRFNVQAGLGVCNNIDKIQALFSGGDGFALSTASANSSLSFGNIMSNCQFDSRGLFFSTGIRIFPSGYSSNGQNFDGSYIEINYRYNAYSVALNANPNGSSSRVAGSNIVKVQNNGLNMLFGGEFTTEGKIHTTHDFFIGLGFKNVTYNEFSQYSVDETVGGYTTTVYEYRDSSNKLKQTNVTILMGYSFGIGF